MDELKSFPVWMEGYRATGQHAKAEYLGMFDAPTFKEACKMSIQDSLNWEDLYDEENNTFWAMKFFDNEEEARKTFG